MAFQTIEGKLYKLHLDNWEPFIKAMDDDFNKINEFKFHHPQNTHKEFFRHYVYLPANGCTFMMVGQMRKAEDSACVRIVIHSVNFKDSYLAIYDYEHCFRNPDLMAGMLVHGFNESLKGTGLRMTFEPWDTMGKDIRWLDDHELTYNINYHRTMGKHVSKMGYEDLKAHHKTYMKVTQAQVVIPPRAIAVFPGRFCKASLDRVLMDIAHKNNEVAGVVARFTLESVL